MERERMKGADEEDDMNLKARVYVLGKVLSQISDNEDA
jgi:hypothetical protein